MTPDEHEVERQRQLKSAHDRVEETIAVLLSFHEDWLLDKLGIKDTHDLIPNYRVTDSNYRRYRDKVSANIIEAVIGLTRERTPEELADLAQKMVENQQRWKGLRWAERQP